MAAVPIRRLAFAERGEGSEKIEVRMACSESWVSREGAKVRRAGSENGEGRREGEFLGLDEAGSVIEECWCEGVLLTPEPSMSAMMDFLSFPVMCFRCGHWCNRPDASSRELGRADN